MARVGGALKSLLLGVNNKKTNPSSIQEYAIRFIDDLYNVIKKKEAQSDYVPSKTFKPSSMKCPRNMQFQILGEEPEKEDISPSLIRIGECGTDSHLRLQNWINEMKDFGINCEYVNVAEFVESRQAEGQLLDLEILKRPTEQEMETKLYNKKWNITFLCDGIIRYLNRYFILEIKTESTFKHSKRVSMNEEHIPQICAYYLSLGIPDIMMVYENRDICSHKAYSVTVTDEMVYDNVTSKINEVNECIEKGIYASAKISSTCNYCKYKKKCKKVNDNEKITDSN